MKDILIFGLGFLGFITVLFGVFKSNSSMIPLGLLLCSSSIGLFLVVKKQSSTKK